MAPLLSLIAQPVMEEGLCRACEQQATLQHLEGYSCRADFRQISKFNFKIELPHFPPGSLKRGKYTNAGVKHLEEQVSSCQGPPVWVHCQWPQHLWEQ